MKKLVVLAVLSLFMLGSLAYATGTRVYTMGEANNIVKDGANIWLYPSTLNYYPNVFRADYEWYDMYDLYQVGGHMMFGEASGNPQVLACYFSQRTYQHDILYEFYDGEGDDEAGRGINLFYGRELGAMPFGLFIGYWFDGYKNEDSLPSHNWEWGMSRYSFSVGLSPMMQQLDISGGIAITSWTDKAYEDEDFGVVDMTKPDGNMTIFVRGRYWMNPMGKYTLIPHAGFWMDSQGLEWYGEDDDNWVVDGTATLDYSSFSFGLGMNYDAATDILVIGDIGIALDKEKIKVDFADNKDIGHDDYEEETGYTILPYFKLGIDGKVFNWMDLRAGVVTIWERWKYEKNYSLYDDYWVTGAIDRSSSAPYTYTYLGAGCHWGNFTLDAAINPDFLGSGPYFVSGCSACPLAEKVSLKYNFLARD